MLQTDPAIVVEPEGEASASVIWLHGLGADANDFLPIVAQFDERIRTRTRFVFPNAPVRSVTINAGYRMRAWYDILEASVQRRVDEQGMLESSAYLHTLIDAQIDTGIAPERVVAAGFSQGGAIALHAGLRHPQRLAGILALSTYMPLAERLDEERSAANRGVSIFLGHGSADPVVGLGLCEQTRQRLKQLDQLVELHTYPMEHAVCPEEIRDIDNWLERVLN
ncbi:MAG: dienelactone hydrolase family protein [Gammaproteobacteria bacterium]|nr:dienelactone hydrolase family protein [Gammaproteobacteria bacterium]